MEAIDWTQFGELGAQIVVGIVLVIILLGSIGEVIRRQVVKLRQDPTLTFVPRDIFNVVEEAIKAAEMVYSSVKKAGPEKFDFAFEYIKGYLAAQGVDIDKAWIRTLITAIHKQLEADGTLAEARAKANAGRVQDRRA